MNEYWHIRHHVLAELLTEPIEALIAYINTEKPEHERAIRLRWMTPVMGVDDPVVTDLHRAQVKLNQAGVVYDQAESGYKRVTWDKVTQAQDDLDRVLTDLEPLHAIEHPGCPWNGRSLFPLPFVP